MGLSGKKAAAVPAAALIVILSGMMASIGGCSNKETKAPAPKKISDEVFPAPSIKYDPERYLCRKTEEPLVIDGRMNEQSWNEPWVLWTTYFVDINGRGNQAAPFSTRAKILWDEDYLYIGAEIQEPHIRAAVTARDGDVYNDNCFEVFIDPDGDTHEYYEVAVNAFGTVLDQLMLKPYRDGGPAVRAWDIAGLKVAVHLDGTVNFPRDADKSWSVEIAMPWKVLAECAHKKVPPDEGDIWAINMVRVQWDADVVDGAYVKATDPETGAPVEATMWTWSPQGIEDMHYPEMYGLVMFTNVMKSFGGDAFGPTPEEEARWALRQIYYAEQTRRIQYGSYTDDLKALGIAPIDIYGYKWPPVIYSSPSFFESIIKSKSDDPDVFINSSGRIDEFPE